MTFHQRLLLSGLAITGLLSFSACGGSKPESADTGGTSPSPSDATARNKENTGRLAVPFDIAMQAALAGHQDTVIQALETGTDPNETDENGRTLLMVSAFNGHVKTMEQLIKAGAKIDTQDLAGRTALMYAATGTHLPTIQLLLENKAGVNLVDAEEHWSPLMFAAAEGNKEVVELLLKHGADTSLTDIDGESAELFARNNGHAEVADFIKNWKSETP